jgi:Carboxypeptidase regulatory-like domain/TonB dependent receptor-like, beta-barrel
MRVRLPSIVLILTASMLLLAGPLPGQTISGIVAGRVTDAQGKPQAAVAIVVTSSETGLQFTGNSDSQGFFRILEVPPGLYEIRALSSMPTVVHTNVRVDVNRTTAENFVLTPQEQQPIPSTAPMTDLYSATLSSPFNKTEVVELPVITRDANNLALLAPGVQSVRTFSFASTLVPFSVNGSRGRDNNFIIDSVDNNEPLFGGAATQFTNNEIIQEYSISTGQLKAEFGRNTGATVNVITKSGSNNWHGTLFGFGQDDVLDAMNRVEKEALLTSPETFYDTTFGGTLGGPIKKDKSFFFLSYQWDRLADNLSDVFPVLSNYPVAGATGLQALQGLPTSPTLQAYLATQSVTRVPNQAGTPCFAGAPPVPTPLGSPQLYSQKNPCLLTPTAVNATTNFGATVPVDFNVYNVPNANTFNLRDHQVSGRFDQKLNDSNDVYARYLFDDLASPRSPLESAGVGAFSDTGLLPDWKTDLRQRTQSFLLDERFRMASGSLNEFRISYSRVSQRQGAFGAPATTLNRPSAIIDDQFATLGTIGGLGLQGTTNVNGQGQSIGLFPSAGDLIQLGQDSSPSRIDSNTYQIQDNFSFRVGRHNIKLGANFAKIDTNTLGMPDDIGFYLYAGGLVFTNNTALFGNGFQNFLSEGNCQSPAQLSTPPFGPAYPSDSCADVASRRLVNVMTNASGQVIGQGHNELKIKGFDQFYFAQDDWRVRDNLTLNLGIRYENFGQPINSVHDINPSAPFVHTDNKDFAPRIGFAWDPWKNGKTVIRGGYGISYNPPILNLPLLIWQSGPVSPLLTSDTAGIAQLQPTGVYPSEPFSISDLQQTLPSGTFLRGTGAIPTAVSTGMVQGCSQYFDLYNTLAMGSGFPSVTPFSGRAYNFYAGNPGPSFNTPAPVNTPIVNCSEQDTVSTNLKNPYVQLWSFGVQRQLGSNFLAEVDYVGSKGTRLFQRVEENPFQGWDPDCLQNLQAVIGMRLANLYVPNQCRLNRINDSHGDITRVTNGGSSSYHALQASLTKRYSHLKYFGDLTFTASYTWSHLIDNTSEIFGPGFRTLGTNDLVSNTNQQFPVGFLFDPLANSPVEAITPLAQTFNATTDAERGNSSFDRRHHFAYSFLWDPFAKKGNLLGGWELGGVFTYQSGQPFSPLNASPLSACADANGDGSTGNDRPDIGNPRLSKGTVALVNLGVDPYCLPAGTLDAMGQPAVLSYDVYNNGALVASNVTPSQAATMAHFVQRPLFVFSPFQSVSGGGAPLPGFTLNTPQGNPNSIAAALGQQYSGTAGRNSLVGPATTELDLALYKTISFGGGERYKLQFRWEVYDVLNHANPGYFNGDPYVGNSSSAPAFGYNVSRTGAAITGSIPENAIDARDLACAAPPTTQTCSLTGRKSYYTFLSTGTLNSSSRRMQFGLRFIF